MKKIIVLLSLVLLVGVDVFAAQFYIPEGTTLRSTIDEVLLQCNSNKATLQDGGVTYKMTLQNWNGSCRTGTVWTQNGNSTPLSICVPGSSRRVQNSVSMRQVQPQMQYTTNRSVEQQILTHGYATSMHENADVGAQYALRGYENAPYQDRQLTRVNHNGVHNMSPTEFDEYKRREDWLRKDEMVTTNVNKSAAEAAVGWTSGGYNRGYNRERYPGEHQIEKLDDWVDLANKVSRMWN